MKFDRSKYSELYIIRFLLSHLTVDEKSVRIKYRWDASRRV